MHAFDEAAVAAGLRTQYVGRQLTFLQETPSTQDIAKSLAEGGAPDGTVVVADSQTAGRGRLERRWFAPPGSSLLVSIVFRPNLEPSQVHRLTMLCSLAVVSVVNQTAGLRLGIKWPNDVVTWPTPAKPEVRKVAGLIAESAIQGERLSHCVVGIGLNVTMQAEDLPLASPPATSLLLETGRRIERTRLLSLLLNEVETRYEVLKGGGAAANRLSTEWVSIIVTLGRQVQATRGNSVLHGIATGVTADGALLVREESGTIHTIAAGDVTLRQ